jgi:hypothetical protein
MTIVRVGQGHFRNVLLVPADCRHRQRIIHQSAGSVQALYWNGWRVNSQVSDPFVVDRVCPARLDKTVDCDLNDDIPEMKGIENAGVEDGDRGLKRYGSA